jgi:type I restriction enzyme S subunit
MLNPVDRRSVNGSETLLSVRRDYGVVVYAEHFKKPPQSRTTVGFKLVRRGELVVNRLQANNGLIFHSTLEGLTSPDFSVLEAKRPLEMEYLGLVLRTHAYRAHFRREATGLGDGRSGFLRLYDDRLLITPVILPPVEEQRAIVQFLEHADRLIRRYIRAKKKLIKILGEEREVVTLAAQRVENTRSLPLEVVAVKVERLVDRLEDRVYTPIGLFNRGRGIFHKQLTAGADLGDSTFFWIEEGDLVLSGQFAWEGAIALAGPEDAGCVATHRYPVLRGKSDLVESAYLLSFFKTELGRLVLDQHSRGAAGRNRPLNARTLMKEKIPVPPLPMQQRIAALVQLEVRLSRIVGKLEELLLEYRTGLIADVVTGKLDVREAAAQLSNQREEPEEIEEEQDFPESDHEPEGLDLEESMAEAEA